MSFRLTPPLAPKLSEKEVIEQCRDYLNARGWWLKRNPVGRFLTLDGNPVDFGPKGIPDYIAVHGRYPAFFAEFKRKGRHLRPDQRSQFEEIQFYYRLAAVMIDSVDDMARWLTGHEARNKPQ